MAGEADPPEDEVELEPPEGDESDAVDQQVADEEADEQVPEGDEVDGEERQPEVAATDRTAERQPSRGESRQQRLANELKEARQRETELNRRLDALIAGQQPRPQLGETPEARAQRLALLTPEERITAELNEVKVGFALQLQQMQLNTVDSNDRASYQAKATVDPLYKKWEPKVEAELAQLRRQGQTVEREKLMYYLIGKNAIENRKGPTSQERRQAQTRVARQTTRPSNAGSDVSASRRETRGNSLERRLENQAL